MGKYKIVMDETETGLNHSIADTIIKGGDTTPLDLLLYAVAGCNGLVIKNLLEANRIDYKLNRIECSGETDPDTNKTSKIDVAIYLSVSEENKAKVEKLSHQIPRFCTVVRSLDPAIDITEGVVFES
ncbi:hypothetical protein AOC36_03300 [Erysipelothrix larvae]|uniref:Osmotically inducible protein OsmC n=1 Tax=Erysipelothrix larvae TaxID=1514105 RepID=A0A0X8GZ19_9FIRM|nr:OsmC family protein [Erysipelothrix larvae]AMC93042.1 hypothetical protein AOC36_03300 [Erysipelothrix larvae]